MQAPTELSPAVQTPTEEPSPLSEKTQAFYFGHHPVVKSEEDEAEAEQVRNQSNADSVQANLVFCYLNVR